MALNDINKTFSFTVNSSMNKYKARSNIVRSITHCKSYQTYAFYKQLFATAAIFKTIRHKIYLKTLKKCKVFGAEVQIKQGNIKDTVPLLVSYETKLKFVEIVMMSVFDLAPALAIIGVILF